MKNYPAYALLGAALCGAQVHAATSGFEDVSMPNEIAYEGPGGGRYWTGAEPPPFGTIESSFSSGSASFGNSLTDFGGGFYSWSGFSYSNTTDTTTPDFSNQYSAIAAGGAEGSANYGVAYVSAYGTAPRIEFDLPTVLGGAWFTNTTYTALAMRDGDAFSKQFGGASGTDPDWLLLTIYGLDASDAITGTLEFYLADFRFEDSADDYIVDSWTFVALDGLGEVTALEFAMSSSDVGAFGVNTPTYFAIDSITPVPVPPAFLLCAPAVVALLRASRRRALPAVSA